MISSEMPDGPEPEPGTDAYEEFQQAKIQEALAVLREHFDAAVILCETIEEDHSADDIRDQSRWWRAGFGSTFAAVEMARQYMKNTEGQYVKKGMDDWDSYGGCDED